MYISLICKDGPVATKVVHVCLCCDSVHYCQLQKHAGTLFAVNIFLTFFLGMGCSCVDVE